MSTVEIPPSSSQPLDEDGLEAQLQHVSEIEAEMVEWKCRVKDIVTLGRDLISEIQSENDYPEDYLTNVTDKVELVSREMSRLETQVPETTRNLSYWRKKGQLCSNLKVLSKVLDQYEAKLNEEGQVIQLYKDNLASHNDSLQHLKTLAKETLLHPGAVIDPSNTIKSDLYNFCERFETLECKFSEEQQQQQHKQQGTSSNASEEVTHAMKQCLVDKDVIVVLQDIPLMEEQLKSDSGLLSIDQANLLRDMIEQLKGHQDRVEAITLWMEEVSAFLNAEDAPYGDIDNLEIQVKDSDALVEDIDTLKSKLDEVNSGGEWLISRCGDKDNEMHSRLSGQLQSVNDTWNHITSKSKSQNASLRAALERSRKLTESLDEITTFVTQLQKDLPEMTPPVKKPTELSQRTFKLLHFKDRIEKKRTLLESLLVLLESPDLIAEATVTKISQIRRQWNDVCQPVIETYQLMKIASTGKIIALESSINDVTFKWGREEVLRHD